MDDVTIRLLEDWESGDKLYAKGTFLAVDPVVADKLVEDEIGERKTREQAQAEEQDLIEAEKKAKREKKRKERQSRVTVIGERAVKDPRGGFKSYGHFLRDVARAGYPNGHESDELHGWKRREKTILGTTAVEYDDSQGGYLVPEEYFNGLMKSSLESAIIRPRATFMPMATNRIAVNAVVDEDHSSNYFGGITLYRPGEAEQKTRTKPTYRQIVLTLHKVVGLCTVSDEIIEDSPQSMEPLLTQLFGEAIAFHEDTDFIDGTGINQALGMAVSNACVTQVAEVGQPPNTVVYQNIVNMWSRLHPPSMNKAIWLCNNDVLPQLYTMALAVGTGGSAVFMPPGAASASPYPTLMGRPLIPTEKCETVGDLGDILLVDPSQYLIGGKSAGGGVKVGSSIHLYFDYDIVAFRFVLRYDGQPWWRVPLTPLKSAITLSPFVKLEAR